MREFISDPAVVLGAATLAVSALSLFIAALSYRVVRLQLATAKKPLGIGIRFGVQEIGILRVRDGREYSTCLINLSVVGPGVLHDVHFFAWTPDSYIIRENTWTPVRKAEPYSKVDSSTKLKPVEIMVPKQVVSQAQLGVVWAETTTTGGVQTQALRMRPAKGTTAFKPGVRGVYEVWVPSKIRLPVKASQWLLHATAKPLPSGQKEVPALVRRLLSPRKGKFKSIIEPPEFVEHGPLADSE